MICWDAETATTGYCSPTHSMQGTLRGAMSWRREIEGCGDVLEGLMLLVKRVHSPENHGVFTISIGSPSQEVEYL